MDALETRELVRNSQQVLERPERDRDERKRPPEREPSHIRLDECHSGLLTYGFISQPLATHGKHFWRRVQPHNVDSSARCRNQDAAGAAPDFKNGTAGLCGGFNEEGDVSPGTIRLNVVVPFRD
jgi:hypothetical protein